MSRRSIYIIFLVIPILLISCNATKYVPADKYLLNAYKIEAEDGAFDKKALDKYIKQKPNKRVLFWKFYLSLYNLSSPEKEKWPSGWLRRIGEPPAVYDEDLKDKSTEQLKLYMNNKGFYNSVVTDSTIYKKRKAKVVYSVRPNVPYIIKDITYFFQDAAISSMIIPDTGSNKFRSGELFDVDVLLEEMGRIENILRDSGYYRFNKEFVYYEVDSSRQNNRVSITLGVKNYPARDTMGNLIHTNHPVYTIRNVYLETDHDMMASRHEGESSLRARDTLFYDSIYVISEGKPNIRPGVVTQKNYIIPGQLFDASDMQRTYRNLSSLSASRMVDIRFREVEGETPMLDCDVRISPATLQSYSLKLEGTNSGGNIGAAANIGYRHRNLFGGSEQFDLSFMGA